MAFDIFTSLIQRKKKAKPGDLFELLVHNIEQFAPKEHQSEREIHYYNYRMISRYKKPLEGLLNTIFQYKQSHGEPAHAAEIFLKLKAFYDMNGHLAMVEAMKDRSLAIKHLRLLLLFYNVKEESIETVRNRISEGMGSEGSPFKVVSKAL